MIRVVLCDDQELVRTGLALILSQHDDIEVVGQAGDGAEAAEIAQRLRPDVVLMDVQMPGVDGIEGTRRILAQRPGTAVLILTTYDLDEYVVDALRLGASGYLLKDSPRSRWSLRYGRPRRGTCRCPGTSHGAWQPVGRLHRTRLSVPCWRG